MADDKETHFGILSGIFAVIMVIALSVMALNSMAPAPTQHADQFGGGSSVSRIVIAEIGPKPN